MGPMPVAPAPIWVCFVLLWPMGHTNFGYVNETVRHQPLQFKGLGECLLSFKDISAPISPLSLFHHIVSRMKKMNLLLRKCRSLSRLMRSSSYSSLRSKSTRDEDLWEGVTTNEDEVVVFVGSSRRRYMISSRHLNHPLMSTIIDRSRHNAKDKISVKCEVVLFDHLLWMLENADPEMVGDGASLEELAQLYVY